MGQKAATFPKDTLKQMKNHYKDHLEATPEWAIFRAKTNNAVITAYQSGKVLFQGSRPDLEFKKWISQSSIQKEINHKERKSTLQHHFHPPETLFSRNHIGSDESGTGDYFGPITTCAVYVKEEQITLLKEIGIQDSKNLTDEKIKELSKHIIEIEVPYSLMILHNEKYNQLQKQGWSQGKMKTMLHASCISSLIKKIADAPYEGIIIDQFCMPDIYEKHLTSERKKIDDKTFFITKAENYSIAVAAGSILARASFVKEMDRLGQLIGTPLLKGASSKVDQLIANIIRKKGEQILPSIAKLHFANTKKAHKYL